MFQMLIFQLPKCRFDILEFNYTCKAIPEIPIRTLGQNLEVFFTRLFFKRLRKFLTKGDDLTITDQRQWEWRPQPEG